ncbi:MAG: hypothetical protein BWK76_19630 [Desulfobulbaceae bacterium A2]|nr:MAG: hypothetical protein BWK76_19630 [Desulfobulbaceae bacterium A2]
MGSDPADVLGPLAGGRVNETYLLADSRGLLVLQRINPAVFPLPHLVTDNLVRVWRHLAAQRSRQSPALGRWCFPEPVPGIDGRFFLADSDGADWRLVRHIPGSAMQVIDRPFHARAMGQCLADLHSLLASADIAEYGDTLPGFHCLDRYLAAYDRCSQLHDPENLLDVVWCRDQIALGRPRAKTLQQAADDGRLRCQLVHGDPKVANFLFTPGDSSQLLGLIDFDTVKPGLLLHDLGDCLRSVANPDEESSLAPTLRLDLCRALLEGYLSRASGLLTADDLALLPDAPWTMTFELGLRFFSDHLAGDRYFRVGLHGDNLRRARSQFLLAEQFCAARDFFVSMIRDSQVVLGMA